RRAGGSLAALDRDFATFIRAKAKATAADATWEKPPDDADAATIRTWLEKHPKNYPGLQRLGARLIKEEKWADAAATFQQLRAMYPEYIAGDNAYEYLAAIYRKTGKPAEEKAVLEEFAKRNSDAISTYQRLIEIAEAEKDWPAVVRNARRWLAVNPLTPAPHRALAKGAEGAKDGAEAMAAYQAVLRFGVPDTADVRYRLAVLLDEAGEWDKARREVLKSLEDAPRSRDALDLLLKLSEKKP
ncbi:MAG TPA: tetratricopeptide repeat protein, partial [Gemmataceae bacterium]|nr:tetratricopeptide repeat protein [Gemmataceae bacterium]